jgi:soluble cytochrome b562
MQRSTKSTVTVAALALAAFVTSFTATTSGSPAVVSAEAGQGGQAPPPPANTPPKPLVPVAASSVAANPDPYVGEYVTMTGAVEANLSKTSFSVDQDKTKATGKDVLVLAPTLQKQAEANGYVTVIGQLIKFDEKEVAAKLKDYQIDLSPADVEKFKGKPVVLATAVINTAGIDIAKKPIPPMNADELALQKIMTKLPPAQAALRKALDGSSADLTKEQATVVKTAFTEIEAFFKSKNNEEATKWAADGKRHADSILMNVANGNFEAAKTSVAPLGATCASCHGKYRERMEDGTYRIKTAG